MPLGQPGSDQIGPHVRDASRLLGELVGYNHRQGREEVDVRHVANILKDWYILGYKYEQLRAEHDKLLKENYTLRQRVGSQSSVWHYLKFLLGIEPCPTQS